MADQKTVSVFDGCKYLYAEQLKGKRITLTIKGMEPVAIVGENGRKDQGFEMAFAETPKLYAFTCVTNRRALAAMFGTEDYRQYAGKRVVLFPAHTGKGEAIRLAPAATEGTAP